MKTNGKNKRRLERCLYFIIFCLCLVPLDSARTEKIPVRFERLAGNADYPLPDDFLREYVTGFQPEEDGSYGETWFLYAVDEKENLVTGMISLSNYRPGRTLDGTTDVFYYPSSGEKLSGHAECTRKAVSGEKGRFDIEAGESYCRKEGEGYRVLLKTPELTVDFFVLPQVEPILLGNGQLSIGDEEDDRFWRVGLPALQAKVTGVITGEGVKCDFKGCGYLDHGKSRKKVPEFSQYWHVMTLITPECAVKLFQIGLKEEYSEPVQQVMAVTCDGDILYNGCEFDFRVLEEKINEESGYKMPTAYELTLENEELKLEGVITRKRSLDAFNVLQRFSWLVRKIVEIIYGEPWQHRCLATFDLTLVRNDETRPIRGTGMTEFHLYK